MMPSPACVGAVQAAGGAAGATGEQRFGLCGGVAFGIRRCAGSFRHLNQPESSNRQRAPLIAVAERFDPGEC